MPRPFVLMIARPKGAGKTTLTRFLREHGVDFGEYINPDDIARELDGSYDTRVAEGGHAVPEDRIVARWHRTMRLLHQAIRVADESFVFDNSATGPSYAGPRLVARIMRDESSQHRVVPALSSEDSASLSDWARRYAFEPLGIGG